MKDDDLLFKILEKLYYTRKNLVGHYYDEVRNQYHIFNYVWVWPPSEHPNRCWKQKLIAEAIYDSKMKRVDNSYHMVMDLKRIV